MSLFIRLSLLYVVLKLSTLTNGRTPLPSVQGKTQHQTNRSTLNAIVTWNEMDSGGADSLWLGLGRKAFGTLSKDREEGKKKSRENRKTNETHTQQAQQKAANCARDGVCERVGLYCAFFLAHTKPYAISWAPPTVTFVHALCTRWNPHMEADVHCVHRVRCASESCQKRASATCSKIRLWYCCRGCGDKMYFS